MNRSKDMKLRKSSYRLYFNIVCKNVKRFRQKVFSYIGLLWLHYMRLSEEKSTKVKPLPEVQFDR